MRRLAYLTLSIAVLLGLTQVPATASTTLTTIAYDGFDYAPGSLLNQNGGTGWAGGWAYSQANDSPLGVTSTGLTYPGLTVTGGATQYLGNRPLNGSARDIPRVHSGIVYVRFLVKLSGGFNNGAPTFRFYDDNGVTSTGWLISNGSGNNAAILNGNGVSVADSGISVNDNATHLLIVRIDYTAQQTDLWVDPNASTFDYASPPAANATATSFAPTFDRIFMFNRVSGSYDEVTVMRLTSSTDVVDPEQVPDPIVQQIGRPSGGECSSVAMPELDWAGVASGGWHPSWAEWMNGGTGGAVCTRTLVYLADRWTVA